MYLILTLAVIAFLSSFVLTPLVRDYFARRGVVDKPDSFRKLHSHPVPRVGGIAIALSYVIAFLVVLVIPFTHRAALEQSLPVVWKLFVAAGLMFLSGLLDDLISLKPWQKFGEQLIAAAMAYSAGVQIHLLPGHPADVWLSVPISIIWIVGCTNAFNLIDGMDGLAAGVGLFATITMLVAALVHEDMQLLLVTAPLAGCLLGFLRYNFNPASVFLGDSGSLLIGFLLGCYGVLWSQQSATLLGMTAPLMAMSIPLLDAGVSVVRRFLRHQPIFEADRGHIHHMLLGRGFTPRRAALLIYAVCGFAAALSLFQDALHNKLGGIVVILFCAAAWIGVQHLGYTEFATARQMFLKGSFRRIIDSQTRLRAFQDSLERAQDVGELWTAIVKGSQEFGFTAARMHIEGRTYNQQWITSDRNQLFQIRIPLSDSQYVNFERRIEHDLAAVFVNGFVSAVSAAVRARIDADTTARTIPVTPAKAEAATAR